MTKNDIPHFCQFSQNFYQLSSSLNIDSGTCVDCMSLSFLRPQPVFKIGEND